ncbi:MAG TPA: DUF2551 domain-containing protein [Methanoculleus sp.]|nr:DUF2551 domain-containing protein [Methanoculleus sp.]
MRTPADLKKEIESRLKKYLSRDKTGIRHELLKLFLKVKSLRVADIYENLKDRFTTSHHSIASMVGIIASKIGILHVRKNKDNVTTHYELKEQYEDIVTKLVGPV